MAGHRTRLAQLAADRWHDGEDEALENYLKSSQAMDQSTARLIALVPRGWLVAGLLGLAPALVYGSPSSGRMAIAVGGTLLAYRAWKRLAAGAWQLAGAAVAWQRTSVLFDAATRQELPGSLDVVTTKNSPLVVDARDLVFRYSDHTAPVLAGANLQIPMGEPPGSRRPVGRRKIDARLLARRHARTQLRQNLDGWIRSRYAGRRRMAQTPGSRAPVP